MAEDKIEIKTQQILNCMFSSWYPTFKSISLKSIILPLDKEFVEYLEEDNFYVRESDWVQRPKEDRFDELDDSKWSDEETPDNHGKVKDFGEFEKQIKNAIEDLGGSVFPKLNWSSPKDATFMSTNGTLKCLNATEIFFLLKSSDFISHDLSHAFDICTDNAPRPKPFPFVLVLRKWFDIKASNEFRCFVKDNILFGVSQRESGSYFEHLADQRKKIEESITKFFKENIQNKFPDSDYIFDVYISKDLSKVYLIDFNPFADSTEPLLFDWDELHTWKLNKNSDSIDFRIVTSRAGVKPSSAFVNRFPVEVNNQQGLSELLESMKMQERNPNGG